MFRDIMTNLSSSNSCCNSKTLVEGRPPIRQPSMIVEAQLMSQPILRWAIAQLRILSWVAYLKMGLAQPIICTGSFYSQTEIILLIILPIFLSLLYTPVYIDMISLNSFIIPRQLICLTLGGSLADKMSIVKPLL